MLEGRLELSHIVAGILLVSRIGDVGTTYLVTPTLRLEMNPIARKLGWRYALLTLLVCIIPLYSLEMGVALAMASLLVSASNAAKVWAVRALGEQRHLDLMLEAARKSKRSHALVGVGASAIFLMMAGGLVLLFFPSADWGIGFWLGVGIVGYGFAIWFHGSLWVMRIFKMANSA